MIEQAISPGRAAAETTKAGRAAAERVSQGDAAELERVLGFLGHAGREIVSSPDLPRAIVVDPDQAQQAATSRRIVEALRAIGWVRKIPAAPGVGFERDQIATKGIYALGAIEQGNRRLAAAPDPAPAAPGPVSTRAQLRAEIMALPAADRLDYAMSLLDEFIGEAPDLADGWRAIGVKLTAAEVRFVGRLVADLGCCVSRPVLQRVLADPADPEAAVTDEGLRAAVSRLRRKIRAAGVPIEIEAQAGRGYAMRAPEGFEIPGQEEGAT